jgi:flagellar biosynthesis chaperone FliJ
MDGDWEPKAEEAAAHQDYEDALAALDAARIDGDMAEIRRLERELEDAKRRWRHASRELREWLADRRRDSRQRGVAG